MRHFPEHEMVNAPEYIGGEVGELVECRPSRQLAVQARDHVDRADTMIAGKGFGEPANKPLGPFPWVSSGRWTSVHAPLVCE